MRALNKLEIRDLNLEIEERLAGLSPLKTLAVVRSFEGRKCCGIGLSDPKRDLILRNFVRVFQSIMKPQQVAAPTSVTITDIAGSNFTCRAYTGDLSTWDSRGPAGYGSQLGFGNPASAPTPARDNYEIASPVARFDPSATQIDETNWRVITTGSYVWVAGGTVRCAGLYVIMYAAGDAGSRTVLLYYDAVADVTVPAGGTVSVTYTTQF